MSAVAGETASGLPERSIDRAPLMLESPTCGSGVIAHGGRFAGVEVLRLVACFGIVWFHGQGVGASYAYGGLPVFMILAVAFAATPSRRSTSRQIVLSRLRRMGVPWVFWSGVYGVLKIGEAWVEHRPISTEFDASMLLVGTRIHLWFLPFGLVATAGIAIGATKGLIRVSPTTWLAWTTAGGFVLVVCSWLLEVVAGKVPWSQWVFVSPAILVGLAMACIPVGSGVSGRRLAVEVVLKSVEID